MKSKEALEKIKNYALEDIDSIPLFAVDLCKSINKEVEEAYKKVLKDLEVLEILKQLAKGVIELKNNNIDITKYVVLISESTNEKIKKWLDA